MSRGGWLSGEPGRAVWSAGDAPIAAPPARPASAPIVLGAKKRTKKPVALDLPTIVVDTREQAPIAPWIWRSGVRVELPVSRGTVATGDYTIAGLEAFVSFERKSLQDLYGTLYGGHNDSCGERAGSLDRFRRELTRMRAIPFRRIVVEASLRQLFEHAYRGSVEPWEVHNLCSSLEVDYGVPFLWAGGASAAGLLVGSACARIWEQAQIGGAGEKKAVKRGIAEHLPWCGTVAKAGST